MISLSLDDNTHTITDSTVDIVRVDPTQENKRITFYKDLFDDDVVSILTTNGATSNIYYTGFNNSLEFFSLDNFVGPSSFTINAVEEAFRIPSSLELNLLTNQITLLQDRVNVLESQLDPVNQPIQVLRILPFEDARNQIYQYIEEHRGVKTSEIILDLGLDVDLVLEVISELQDKDEIESVDS